MIRIEGCSDEECAAIEAYGKLHPDVDFTRPYGVSRALTISGQRFIDGYRATPGVALEAQAVLKAALVYTPMCFRPGKEHTKEFDADFMIAINELIRSVKAYRATLVPPVDLKALEMALDEARICLLNAATRDGYAIDRSLAKDYKEKAQAFADGHYAATPSSNRELELLRSLAHNVQRAIKHNFGATACNDALKAWEGYVK